MIVYLIKFVRVLFAHGVRWYVSLILTYLTGIGIFQYYPAIRDSFNSWQQFIMLPDRLPAWLVVLPFLIWVIVSSTHKETARSRSAPRLVFDEPKISDSILLRVDYSTDSGPDHLLFKICLAKILVRNNPFDKKFGRE